MAGLLDNLLAQLNGTGLQNKDKLDRQDNKKLYDFLRRLLGGTEQIQSQVAVISGAVSPPSSNFVTSTIGGTADEMAMFTATRNIENVTAVGISNALDLL